MRRWSRVVAVMLFLAMAGGLPHIGQDDPACDGAAQYSEAGDASQHGLRAAGPAAGHDHCALCHWTRSLRSPLTPLGVLVATVTHSSPVSRTAAPPPSAPVLEHLPARAPPAPLL
jgi:mono/diheme cytochrome c family protein